MMLVRERLLRDERHKIRIEEVICIPRQCEREFMELDSRSFGGNLIQKASAKRSRFASVAGRVYRNA